MNNVQLIGRLTRDPELRYSTGQNQTAICRFSLAINTGYGDRQRVDYPNIVVFGKIAENCEKYLSKGKMAAVTGRIQTGSYDKDGRKVYTTDVVASSVEFLSPSNGNGNTQNNDNYQNDAPINGMPAGFSAMEDDDIPF